MPDFPIFPQVRLICFQLCNLRDYMPLFSNILKLAVGELQTTSLTMIMKAKHNKKQGGSAKILNKIMTQIDLKFTDFSIMD